jgi:Putative phage tail protein
VARPLTPYQLAALSTAFAPTPTIEARRGTDEWQTLDVIGGEVSYDGSSTERTTLTASVALDHAPTEWGSLLVPADSQLRVTFALAEGPPIVCATVWLDAVTVTRPDSTVELSAVSRATRVAQAGFPPGDRRYTGTTAAVIEAIVEAALGVPVTVDNRGVTGPLIPPERAFLDVDPWQAVEDLCDAAGAEAYFDSHDVLVIRPVPTATGTPAWDLAPGDDGTIIRYATSLTRAPNDVSIVFTTDDGLEIRGTAVATGPAAPSGPYGRVTYEDSRPGTLTQAQADAAALDYLTRAGGIMRTLTLEIPPHPGIEVGDVARVTFVNGSAELHRITSVILPLTPGAPTSLTTKSLPW